MKIIVVRYSYMSNISLAV